MVDGLRKGLSIRYSPVDQPEGTYTFALNVIDETQGGHTLVRSNEPGNELCAKLPDGYQIFGHVYKNDDNLYIFSGNGGDGSEIGLLSRNCGYTTIINSRCLNFKNRIDVIYRVRKGCEDTLYFTDGLNPTRVINLSDLDQYYVDGEFDCDLLNITRSYEYPCIADVDVLNGTGSLQVGQYKFVFRYLDGEGNPTNFFYELPSAKIFPGTNFSKIEGAFDSNSDPINGIGPVSKSIQLTFTGLDDRFDSYQIGIAIYRGGTGVATEFLVSPEISTENESFLFTGDISGYTQTSLAEFQQGARRINTAEHIAQLENRLLLANTKGAQVNGCNFQQFASKIYTKYVIREVPATEIVDGSPKSGSDELVGFMGDEVYALGIVYVLANGEEVGPFHIPGRPKNKNPDLCVNLPVGDSWGARDSANYESQPWDKDIEHIYSETEYASLLPADKAELERWQVYNTAWQESPGEGYMGYYETQATYPEWVDCDGNSVWGEDSCGNSLAGQEIRHHRMPGRDIEPHYQNTYGNDHTSGTLRHIGVRFFNIDYPSGVVSHYFVAAKRTASERSVVGKAYLSKADNQGGQAVADPKNYWEHLADSNYALIYSPDISQEKDISFDFITNEHKSYRLTVQQTESLNVENDIQGTFDVNGAIALFGETQTRPWANSLIYNQGYVDHPPSSLQIVSGVATQPAFVDDSINFSLEVRNRSHTYSHYFLETNRNFSYVTHNTDKSLYYVGIKKNAPNMFSQLFSLNYFRITSCNYNASDIEQVAFQGDTYITKLDVFDYTLDQVSGPPNFELKGNNFSMYVESYENTSLRTSGDESQQFFDLISFDDETKRRINRFIVNAFRDDNSATGVREATYDDYFVLNPDYSIPRVILLKSGFKYDCCSDCLEEFPNQIMWSEQSFDEQGSDNYRIFLPNNYRDIEAQYGEITEIFTKQNNLIALTRESFWRFPQNVQERITDDVVSFLGTGEYFSIPPRAFGDDELGTGGTQHKWSLVKTPFGVVWVNELENNVYLYDDQLRVISDELTPFFEDRLQPFLKIALSKFNISYNDGENIHTVYDPRYKRVIITKLDYEPINFSGPVLPNTIYEEGVLYYRESDGAWLTREKNDVVAVDLGNPQYFVNKSWTLSYSFKQQGWVSWHSYMPRYYFRTRNHFFSAESNSLWRHNTGRFQTYYGTYYPYILEYISNENVVNTKVFDYIVVQTESFRWAGNLKTEVRDYFFTQMIAYNSRQSTGLIDIISKVETDDLDILMQDAVFADRNERDWTINNIVDFVDDYDESMFSEDWDQIKENYFIDKVVNNNVINTDKPWYELERMRDKYLITRLILNDDQNIQLVTHFVINPSYPSKR
jgi:hypothetical protein